MEGTNLQPGRNDFVSVDEVFRCLFEPQHGAGLIPNYTGEDDGSPLISWNYTTTAVEGTIQAFDHVVHQILSKNYSRPAQSLKTCRECDFNAYCAQATFRTKENPQ